MVAFRFIYRIEEIIGPHGWKLDKNRKKQKFSQVPVSTSLLAFLNKS